VLDAVTAVLSKSERWMGPKEIWLAAELLLGRQVSRSSVRNCLVDHLDGLGARFERDNGRRRYRLRQAEGDDFPDRREPAVADQR
jgi:hypothetical protein